MLEANSFLALFILIPNLGIVECRTLSKGAAPCWSILRVSPLILGGDNSLVRQPFVLPLHPQLCRVQASVAVLKLYLPYTLGRVGERRLECGAIYFNDQTIWCAWYRHLKCCLNKLQKTTLRS